MVGRRFAWVCGVTLALGMGAHSATHAQVRSQELRASEDPGEFYSAGMQAGDTYILIGEQSLEDQKASVAVSGDGGATWTQENEGIAAIVPTSLVVSGNRLYLGTQGCGVWSADLTLSAGTLSSVILPEASAAKRKAFWLS